MHFLVAFDTSFLEINRKKRGGGGTELNVAQIDFKVSFQMPKFPLNSMMFWFSSLACLFIDEVINFEKRITRLITF